jgi:hypothetical protein
MIRLTLAALSCAVLTGVAVSACSPTSPQREVCANNVDDDQNGFIDCADPDCRGKPECVVDAGFFGPCAKCGTSCAKQEDCLQTSFANDQPLPLCVSGRCEALNKQVSVNVILDAAAYQGVQYRSITTRFISKTAVDGTPVTCSTVGAAAPGRTAAMVRQLEDTGRFQYLGFDARTIMRVTPSIPIFFVPVQTGSNYLIFMEFWFGPIDGVSRFPTLNRAGFECFDGPAIGQTWAPIISADDCAPAGQDAGSSTCRQFQVSAIRGPM